MKAALAALKAKLAAEGEARRPAEVAEQSRPSAKPRPPLPRHPSNVEVWRPNDLEQRLFEVAMAGVVPLPPKGASPVLRKPQEAGIDPGVKHRRRLAAGGDSLTPRWAPDGSVSGVRRGCEFALEALERFATPADKLDLHGVEPGAVPLRVQEFLRTRRARGMRCVMVITGHGKSAPDHTSVIVDVVVATLSTAPASGDLDAFVTAPTLLGGRGAILVALRG
jgi:DNA-nicking Smr family endonuclease